VGGGRGGWGGGGRKCGCACGDQVKDKVADWNDLSAAGKPLCRARRRSPSGLRRSEEQKGRSGDGRDSSIPKNTLSSIIRSVIPCAVNFKSFKKRKRGS